METAASTHWQPLHEAPGWWNDAAVAAYGAALFGHKQLPPQSAPGSPAPLVVDEQQPVLIRSDHQHDAKTTPIKAVDDATAAADAAASQVPEAMKTLLAGPAMAASCQSLPGLAAILSPLSVMGAASSAPAASAELTLAQHRSALSFQAFRECALACSPQQQPPAIRTRPGPIRVAVRSGSGDSAGLSPCSSDKEAKDAQYWERRRKNNEAAKRSREARRVKEQEIALRAQYLDRENVQLKLELAHLRAENSHLRIRLLTYLQNGGCAASF